MEEFRDWLVYFNGFSAVPGFLYFIFRGQSRNMLSVVVFTILASSFLSDNFNYFFMRLIYPNGFIIGNIWYLINFLLSCYLFGMMVKKRKMFFSVLAIIFSIGSIVTFLFFFRLSESNTFIRLFSNVSLILFSLMAYFELLKNPNKKLKKQPSFWISTAFFLSNSLILLQNVFNNYLIFDLKISESAVLSIYVIKLCANIFMNFSLFYVLVLLDKEPSPQLKKAS